MGEAIITRKKIITVVYSGGGTLVVSAPPNATVTVTNGTKTYTKSADSSGSVTFEGLTTGTWTITASKSGNTNSTTIDIVVDYEGIIEYDGVPIFTYTGSYQIVDDSNNVIQDTDGNWKIRFLTSGKLTFSKLRTAANGIDVFCVGGGANGQNGSSSGTYDAVDGGDGGSGGKTTTKKGVSVVTGTEYTITVGGAGGQTSAFGVSAAGGTISTGGSGGGKGGAYNIAAGSGGSDGSDGGAGGWNYPDSTGQGTTTREFGESGATLYSGGGGGGGGRYGATYGSRGSGGAGGGGAGGKRANGVAGTANLGGGGGGGGSDVTGYSGGAGGSGIVVIRNARG